MSLFPTVSNGPFVFTLTHFFLGGVGVAESLIKWLFGGKDKSCNAWFMHTLQKKQIVFFWKELQFARWLTCNFIQLKLIWKEVWKFVIQDSIGRWYNHLSREVKAPFVVPVCNFLPWQRRGLWDTRENWKFSKEWQAFFSIPSPQTGKTELGIFLEQAKFPPVNLKI